MEDDPDSYDDVEFYDDDVEVDHGATTAKESKRASARGGQRLTRVDWDTKIKAYVEQKGREDLAGLVWSLIERFPELRQEFQERIAFGEGKADQLVAAARRELRAVTAEFGWRNHWSREGHTPDYQPLKHRLELLAELGYCDQVVELGRELISLGIEQVGQSDDEGETSAGLADCLGVVFKAVGSSSLSAPDKLLFVIDACLKDEYDIVGEAAGKILNAKWSSADWSVVANQLQVRLQKAPHAKGSKDFTQKYSRKRLSHYVLDALDRAGRGNELRALYEAEARETDSYERLVDYLIEQKEFEDAERWAQEGIAQTRQKYPGIAAGLAKSLCDLARRRKQWDVVAAHAASNFFSHPSWETFRDFETAAKQAKLLGPVRAAALRFLETGVSPVSLAVDGKRGETVEIDSTWPLPLPAYLVPLMFERHSTRKPRPYYRVLVDIAIHNKRPADVLRWYDAEITSTKLEVGGPHSMECDFDSDRVAKAIKVAYPQRAIEIYRRKLDAHLRQASKSAYGTCAACLRSMRPIYKALDQEDYWKELLADIRHNYRNRPRLMEVLDRLAGKSIVESQRSSRKR